MYIISLTKRCLKLIAKNFNQFYLNEAPSTRIPIEHSKICVRNNVLVDKWAGRRAAKLKVNISLQPQWNYCNQGG